MELKSRINYWKEQRGRTTKWLAKELNTSPEIVSRWANNKSMPSVKKLFILADLLECTADDLYERDSND
ncbi:helix-turn-helix transcriptional regulator [Virgibacillus halophilus]|uniref:helix-turn-helix transcriptional regulator n=1 Tax=Tigheibacillus halophilus TaxID=361280 RepID=UPI00363C6103